MSDINQEILAEIRRMRRTSQWSCGIALGMLAILIVFVLGHMPSKSPWTAVTAAMQNSDYPKGLALAQAVVAQRPNDYYGHWYLGKIYLAMGDTTHAETEYARAYELYPTDSLQKELEVIRKRGQQGSASAAPASTP